MPALTQAVANVEVLTRLGSQALRRGRNTDSSPDVSAFRANFDKLLQQAPGGLIANSQFVNLPANQPPWQDSGMSLSTGRAVTTFACGRTWLSRALDIHVGPHFQLWMRVGTDGPIFRGTRASHSFVAEQNGSLNLASYFPGEWGKPDGTLGTSPKDYKKVSGSMTVLVIRWADGVTPEQGLEQLAAMGDVNGMVADERDRLGKAHTDPDGWSSLWFLGPSEIYSRCDGKDGNGGICCHTHEDVAILQHEVDIPLRPDTTLSWSWKVDELPSKLREDTVPTHDYLSIATEFDNGLDLSYIWSAKLPVGRHFWCPLPTWKGREWHWVVRSGNGDLGQWHDESQQVLPDYKAAIKRPVPQRIVRVWLISVSLFQRHEGRCAYSNIQLSQGGKTINIE